MWISQGEDETACLVGETCAKDDSLGIQTLIVKPVCKFYEKEHPNGSFSKLSLVSAWKKLRSVVLR